MATIPFSEILELSVPERIQLAEDIWDSIAAEQPDALPPLTEAQTRELDRHPTDIETNPGMGVTWAEARARLLGSA